MSKLTDYGTVVLAQLARLDDGRHGERAFVSAAEIASATGLGLPTVSKLLKALARAGLVTSTRGAHGGYQLARAARNISAASVIDALEGPVSITECSGHDSHCDFEEFCNVGGAWQRINVAIRRALNDISLEDLVKNNRPVPRFVFAGTPVMVERKPERRR